MYKKRFAKWGFYKNAPSARRRCRDPTLTAHSVLSQRRLSINLFMEPGYLATDAQNLLFLNSIKAWSSAFFETELHGGPHSDLDFLVPIRGTGEQPLDLEQLSFSFRLVSELLQRGHGVPAGRLARKSFLQVENILNLEGPLVTWNLLEMLHNIALLGQTRLFEILVRHMCNLSRSRFPRMHPLIQMLSSLQDLMRRSPYDPFPEITTLIERGWLLNAGLVFSNIHSRFQLIYHRLIWDSKQLRLPPEVPRQISDWYDALQSENQEAVQAAADFEEMDGHQLEQIMYASMAFPTNVGYAQRSGPPPNYHALRLGSIADLRRLSEIELVDQDKRLRVLIGLMKSRIPNSNSRPTSTAWVDDGVTLAYLEGSPGYKKVPRLHVRVVASMARIALDTDLDLGINKHIAAEKLRGIISLREYGQGAIDPQVVYDFWQLRDVLARAGRLHEAAEAAREAITRLDYYLENIPETLDGR